MSALTFVKSFGENTYGRHTAARPGDVFPFMRFGRAVSPSTGANGYIGRHRNDENENQR